MNKLNQFPHWGIWRVIYRKIFFSSKIYDADCYLRNLTFVPMLAFSFLHSCIRYHKNENSKSLSPIDCLKRLEKINFSIFYIRKRFRDFLVPFFKFRKIYIFNFNFVPTNSQKTCSYIIVILMSLIIIINKNLVNDWNMKWNLNTWFFTVLHLKKNYIFNFYEHISWLSGYI